MVSLPFQTSDRQTPGGHPFQTLSSWGYVISGGDEMGGHHQHPTCWGTPMPHVVENCPNADATLLWHAFPTSHRHCPAFDAKEWTNHGLTLSLVLYIYIYPGSPRTNKEWWGFPAIDGQSLVFGLPAETLKFDTPGCLNRSLLTRATSLVAYTSFQNDVGGTWNW